MGGGWRAWLRNDWFWALVLLPLLGFIFFSPYLSAPFIYDDLHTVRDNPYLMKLDPLYFFSHPESASLIPSTLTRPLLTFTYALDLHRGGLEPRNFHLTNLALHVLNALLVFALTRQTRKLKALALPAALLFLLHPLAAINVGYVSCRSTLLSATFYLAALILFARGQADPAADLFSRKKIVWLAAMALAGAAALLSKESAATLPAAVLLWAAAFRDRQYEIDDCRGAIYRAPNPDGRKDPEAGGHLGPPLPGAINCAPTKFYRNRFTILAVILLALVLGLFLSYRAGVSAPTFFPPARPWPVWQYLSAEVRVFWTYARLLVWPIHLSLEHEAWVPASPARIFSLGFLASAGGLLALVVLALRYLKKEPELSFAALFSILYLLPTSSVVPLTVLVNENRPYLSSLLFIWPGLRLCNLVRARWPRTALALISSAMLFFVLLLWNRGPVYQNDLALWQDAVRKAPGLARSHVNLGTAYLAFRRNPEASAQFQWALELEPCSAPALNNLGNVADRRGDKKTAEQFYRQAQKCDPASVTALLNLSSLLLESGRPAEARTLLEQARRLRPASPEVQKRLAELPPPSGLKTRFFSRKNIQPSPRVEPAIRATP